MKKILLTLAFSAGFPLSLFSQCIPLSAQICVSGNDTTQVWVNGYYVGSKEYCSSADGCDASHLCLPVPIQLLQNPRVCLALKTTTLNPPVVFSSWELEVDCQGATFIVNNEETFKAPVALYWDPTGGFNCGQGSPPLSDAQDHNWMDPQYHPASNPFTRAGSFVTADTGPAVQINSDLSGAMLHFISHDATAAGAGPYQGCGILYWRQVAELPGLIPTSTPYVFLTPTPVFTKIPTLAPKPTLPPWPTATPTETWTHIPTFTPWPTSTPYSPPRSLPTLVTRPLYVPPLLPAQQPLPPAQLPMLPARIWPTPTRVWIPPVIVAPLPTWTRTPLPKAAVKTSPPPTTWLPNLDKEHNIVFGSSPAEIYVTFSDGPGLYQLEIVDTQAKAVKVIYNRRVGLEDDAWVEWDGKDAQGRDMPVGQYFVVFFENGKAIRSISIQRNASK